MVWSTKSVFIGMLAYVNKTHTDVNGHFKLEPLILAMSIFKASILRSKHECKILLSYLVDLELKSSALNRLDNTSDKTLGGVNIRNYHRQLHAALSGLQEIQNGIKM